MVGAKTVLMSIDADLIFKKNQHAILLSLKKKLVKRRSAVAYL